MNDVIRLTPNPTTSWISHQDQDKVEDALTKYRPTAAFQDHLANNGCEHYALWMVLLDQRLTRAIGLSSGDLEDFCSWDSFEAGESPSQGARTCIESSDMASMFDL